MRSIPVHFPSHFEWSSPSRRPSSVERRAARSHQAMSRAESAWENEGGGKHGPLEKILSHPIKENLHVD
jgi:hypothetical protein